jgi:hypothetical protein
MITQKVLVSPKFRMDSQILNQIGEHRAQLKIRHDHWVPFLVVSGLRCNQVQEDKTDIKQSLAEEIISKIVKPQKLKGYYRLPLKRTDPKTIFPGWKIPEDVTTKTTALCTELSKPAFLPKLGDRKLQFHWERDEYRFLIEQSDLFWPQFVEHKKLKLLRNRYPVVPGFDVKARDDRYKPVVKVDTVPSPKDYLKKPTTWKVKNIIPKEGVVHRYSSLRGKSFPIMRKTAETSRFKKAQ